MLHSHLECMTVTEGWQVQAQALTLPNAVDILSVFVKKP